MSGSQIIFCLDLKDLKAIYGKVCKAIIMDQIPSNPSNQYFLDSEIEHIREKKRNVFLLKSKLKRSCTAYFNQHKIFKILIVDRVGVRVFNLCFIKNVFSFFLFGFVNKQLWLSIV